MTYLFYFWAIFFALSFMIIYCDIKYAILRDMTQAYHPYSWGRVQLAWWTVIILTSFISILLIRKTIPTFHDSTLILLGISAATTATARVIDISEKPVVVPLDPAHPKKCNFFLDIMSDEVNVNMHRFQTVIFNAVFGIWFVNSVLTSFYHTNVDMIMPVISMNNLILIGLISATYAALKTTENKTSEIAEEARVEAEASAAIASTGTTAPVLVVAVPAEDISNSEQHER